MSTRATVHFRTPGRKTTTIVYRHSDGYPEGLGSDLVYFIQKARVEGVDLTSQAAVIKAWKSFEAGASRGAERMPADPDDIEYRWLVFCDGFISRLIYETPGREAGRRTVMVPEVRSN